MLENIYTELIAEHSRSTQNRRALTDATIKERGHTPSCGDEIFLELKISDGVISDAAFGGTGCAISQASADIMLELVIGREKEEALRLADIFLRMIKGKITDEEKEELEEAGVLEDIAHMPARVKCAVLGWHTMQEMFEE